MAMNAGNSGATAGLAKIIYDNLNAELGAGTGHVDTDRRKFAFAIADAVVSHITSNAVVAVASVSGVTAGAGTSGPGAGTIS